MRGRLGRDRLEVRPAASRRKRGHRIRRAEPRDQHLGGLLGTGRAPQVLGERLADCLPQPRVLDQRVVQRAQGVPSPRAAGVNPM